MEKVDKHQVEEPQRLEYERPLLIEYGSLDELTLSGGSGAADLMGTQDGMGNNGNGNGMN